MVAVYMLGHRVGHIEEPVIYVNHHSYNYEGQLVTKGIPDPDLLIRTGGEQRISNFLLFCL